MKNVVVINLTKTLNERNNSELCNTSLNKQYNPDTTGVSKHFEKRAVYRLFWTSSGQSQKHSLRKTVNK